MELAGQNGAPVMIMKFGAGQDLNENPGLPLYRSTLRKMFLVPLAVLSQESLPGRAFCSMASLI